MYHIFLFCFLDYGYGTQLGTQAEPPQNKEMFMKKAWQYYINIWVTFKLKITVCFLNMLLGFKKFFLILWS